MSTIEALRAENASLRNQQQRFPSHNSECLLLRFSKQLCIPSLIIPAGNKLPSAKYNICNRQFTASMPRRSSICPSNYDAEKICWTKADYCKNPANGLKPANRSRPKMAEALRHPDTYAPLTTVQWDSVRSNAGAIVTEMLMPLEEPKNPQPTRGKSRTAEWYQRNYPQVWRRAIGALEQKEPITTYCAGPWKATDVFRIVLRRAQGKKGADNEGGDEIPEDDGDDAVDSDIDSPSTKKKRPRRSSETPRKKAKRNNPKTPTEEDSRKKPSEEPDLHKQIAKPLASSNAEQHSDVPSNIDVSFIQVDHSIATLKEHFTQFPVNHANEVLDALAKGIAALSLQDSHDASQLPSHEAAVFLTNIDDADPNAETFDPSDDDNNNSGWGHYQYTTGGRTITSSLLTWDSLGSIEFAQKLLAAALKTCKVARYLCQARKRPSPSFISDVYLANLVEHIWALIPTDYKELPEQPGGSGGTNEQGGGSVTAKDLDKWIVDDLKAWVSEKVIAVPSNVKNLRKPDYINLILGVEDHSKRPTPADVLSVIQKRAASKKSKSKKPASPD
ncbi:hypothetical protein NMY22_g19427 [Coprinellus aureogranulatus]|nr:hypothetical protein NMY22_g19427 [Coprinellus aureogranulatus]